MPTSTNVNLLPDELKTQPIWLYAEGKLPKSAHYNRVLSTKGRPLAFDGSTKEPATWDTLDACVKAAGDNPLSIVVVNPYIGIDLDHCYDPETQTFTKKDCEEIFLAFKDKTYIEFSKSGTGIHIICKGQKPNGAKKSTDSLKDKEMYQTIWNRADGTATGGRHFVTTGKRYGTCDLVTDQQETINYLFNKYWKPKKKNKNQTVQGTQADSSLLTKLNKSSKFKELFSGDYSSGDLSSDGMRLMIQILLKTQDHAQAERIYRQSAICQRQIDKGNHGNMDDYISRTIQNALNHIKENKLDAPSLTTETGRFDHYVCGQYALEQLHAAYLNSLLHVYKDGYIYQPTDVKRAICDLWGHRPTPTQTDTLYKYLTLSAQAVKESAGNLIQFNNCVLDIETMQTFPCSPDFVILNTIPHDYRPEAQSVPLVDQTFKEWACDDSQIERLMFEWIGYNMTRYCPIHAFAVLKGNKRNGKSVYLNVLQAVIGDHNYCTVPLKDLEARFKSSSYYGKLANISDENKGGFLEEPAILKQLCSGSSVTAEFKGRDEFSFNNYAKSTFSFNNEFSFKDDTNAALDRLVFIPFDADFSDPKKQNPKLTRQLTDKRAIEYIIAKAVLLVHEAIERNVFTRPDRCAELYQTQERNNKPYLDYIEEQGLEYFLTRSNTEIYSSYSSWCYENGCKPVKSVAFGRLLCKELDLVSYPVKQNGKLIRYYRYKQ